MVHPGHSVLAPGSDPSDIAGLLIVEDDAEVRSLVATLLEDEQPS
jgi:hypothetical protein